MDVASRRLTGAIAQLGPADRALLNLWVQRGMDDGAIARLSSAPTEAVAGRRQALVDELADHLGLAPADVLAALERMARHDGPDAPQPNGPGPTTSPRRTTSGDGASADRRPSPPPRARPQPRAHRASSDPDRAVHRPPPRARPTEPGPRSSPASATAPASAPPPTAAQAAPRLASDSVVPSQVAPDLGGARTGRRVNPALGTRGAETRRPAHPSPEPTPTHARRTVPRRALLIAALLIVLAAVVVVLARSSTGGRAPSRASASSAPPARDRAPASPSGGSVGELQPLPGIAWHGRATITLAGPPGRRSLDISVTALSALRRDHYEAWLYNSISDAVPLGKLIAPVAHLHAALPANYRRYAFVDVSLQGPSSGPNHSGQSVLRAPLP